MRRLTEDEYKAFDAIPREDWEGHDFSAGTVSFAYVMPGERWEHVLVESQDKNVNLVLVLDLEQRQVLGHHLLDVNRLYRLNDG